MFNFVGSYDFCIFMVMLQIFNGKINLFQIGCLSLVSSLTGRNKWSTKRRVELWFLLEIDRRMLAFCSRCGCISARNSEEITQPFYIAFSFLISELFCNSRTKQNDAKLYCYFFHFVLFSFFFFSSEQWLDVAQNVTHACLVSHI